MFQYFIVYCIFNYGVCVRFVYAYRHFVIAFWRKKTGPMAPRITLHTAPAISGGVASFPGFIVLGGVQHDRAWDRGLGGCGCSWDWSVAMLLVYSLCPNHPGRSQWFPLCWILWASLHEPGTSCARSDSSLGMKSTQWRWCVSAASHVIIM